MKGLEPLFNPRSVAVVGASSDPTKWGNLIARALIRDGYKGLLYLVNQKGGEVCGIQTYRSLRDIPDRVDLGIIGIPAPSVPRVVREGVECGIKVLVIVTAGFGETGEEGKEVERDLVALAKESGTRLVGPNCLGVYNRAVGLNATILPLTPGSLGLVTQSGNLGLEISYLAARTGSGFSKFVSLGNQIDVEFHEYLDYLGNDGDTKSILLCIEGLKDGRKFLEVARAVTRLKPVVAMKIGRTSTGRRSARSHTGSLAGREELYDAAFRQAGIIKAKHSADLLGMGKALADLPRLRGNRIAILTEGGGHATLASDVAEESGLEVPVLSARTREKLAQVLLPHSSTQNPVDFAGAADEDLWTFVKCTEILLEDPDVDGLVVVGQFGGYSDLFPGADVTEEKVAAAFPGLVRKYQKPVTFQSMYARENPKCLDILQRQGIPVYESVETAMAATAALFRYSKYLDKQFVQEPPQEVAHPSDEDMGFCRGLLERVRSEKRLSLLEPEAMNLVKRFGIPVREFALATTGHEAASHARRIGFPVALKIVSPDILHKTEARGVLLDVNDERAVQDGFEELVRNVRSHNADADIRGVMVSPMADKGLEVAVGAIVDETFGPCLMFGLGGIYLEVFHDVSFRVAPLARGEAMEMIREIKAFPLLEGTRGQRPADIEAIAEIVTRISEIVVRFPQICELDLNPVFVYGKGALVVDARVLVAP